MAAPNTMQAPQQSGRHPPRIDHANIDQANQKPVSLLQAAPRVINIGLEVFARDLAQHTGAVQHVHWAPPARADAHLAALLSKLGC